MTTTPITVREMRPGYWTAIQLQGAAQLPVTVADGAGTAEAVVRGIEARKRVGWIHPATEVIVLQQRKEEA